MSTLRDLLDPPEKVRALRQLAAQRAERVAEAAPPSNIDSHAPPAEVNQPIGSGWTTWWTWMVISVVGMIAVDLIFRWN